MNQRTLLIAIATLIVAIFAFAQVYIIFTVTTINDRVTRLETRLDKRLNLIETRLDALNQNYIDHLAHHTKK